MKSNESAENEEVNWADYFDSLENEIWLESQKRNRPNPNFGNRKEPEMIAGKLQNQSRNANP